MQSTPFGAVHAVRPSDRLGVVEHVHDTADLQETDWLEWKSGYDLTTAAGRASTAKQILGLANRMPDVAARNVEGYGYLLLGVEPGVYHDMPLHDPADVENWLRPYLGENVLYDIHYVNAGGTNVLFFAIDPPKWGDDIHTLRKQGVDEKGLTVRQGTIFVRKSGKTEPATDTDVDRLTERARRQGVSLVLSVEADGPLTALPSNCFDDEFRDQYLDHRRKRLLASITPPSGPYGLDVTPGETRTREQFQASVDKFVEDARAAWVPFAIVKLVEERQTTLQLSVVNQTDDNFEDVQVELTVPIPHPFVFADIDDARDRAQPPEEPKPWGKLLQGLLAGLRTGNELAPAVPEIEDVGKYSTLVRFPPVHVRPRSRHDLADVIVAAPPKLVGETMKATWRATSRSTRGEVVGELSFEVETTPPIVVAA